MGDKSKLFGLFGLALIIGLPVMCSQNPNANTNTTSSTDAEKVTSHVGDRDYPEEIIAGAAGMSSKRFDGLANSKYGTYNFHAAKKLDFAINFHDHTLYLPSGSYAYTNTDGKTWNYASDEGENTTATATAGENGMMFKVMNSKGKVIKTFNADYGTIAEQFQKVEAKAIISELAQAGILTPRVYVCPGYKLIAMRDGDGFGTAARAFVLTDRNFKHPREFLPNDGSGIYATDPDGNTWGVNDDTALKNDGQQICQFDKDLSDAVQNSFK